MVHHRLGQQIVKTALVAALGGRIVDLEQRFGFGPADRLMLDGGRGQDARAPGGVIGIQLAGKMNPAFGGRAFAGDDAIAHDGQRLRSGIPAGNLGGFQSADRFGGVSKQGQTLVVTLFSFCSGPAFSRGRKRVVNDSKLANASFLDGCRLVAGMASTSGFEATAGRGSDAAHKRRNRGNLGLWTHYSFFAAGAATGRRC